MASLPSHPDTDRPGRDDAESAFGGGPRRLRILGVVIAVALVVLVVVLHVTGVIGAGGH